MGTNESIDRQNLLMDNFNGYLKLLRSIFQQNKNMESKIIIELFVDSMKLFKKFNTRYKNETYHKFNAIRDLYLTYNIIGPKSKFELGWTWKMQKSDAKRWTKELKELKKKSLAIQTIKSAEKIIQYQKQFLKNKY